MDKNKRKEQFPVIDIASRLEIKIVYPDYTANRTADNIDDEDENCDETETKHKTNLVYV